MTLPGQASVPTEAFTYLADMIRDFPEKFAQLPMPDNAIDAAEGNRLFLRYLTIGIEQFIEYTDPAYPDFQQKTRAGVRKFAGDSPAQLYDSSPVSSKYQYIVTGSMAETELIELTVYSGDLSGANKTPRRLIDAITEAEIDTTTDGSFTLTVAAGHEGRNGVKLDTDASVLSVRRYLRDPRVDRPRPLSIRRIGGPVNPPPSPLMPWPPDSSAPRSSRGSTPELGHSGWEQLRPRSSTPSAPCTIWATSLPRPDTNT